VAIVVCVAAVLIAPASADAEWAKQLVAAAGDTIGASRTIRSLAWPSLNDKGDAAFYVTFTEGGSGVALWDGGRAGLVAFTGQRIKGYQVSIVYCPPSINDGGEIVFAAQFGAFKGIVRRAADGATFEILVRTDQPFRGYRFWDLGCPVINNAGDIVFPGWHGYRTGIFSVNDGLRLEAGMMAGHDTLKGVDVTRLSMNDSGIVAVLVDYMDPTSRWGSSRGIFAFYRPGLASSPSGVLLKTGDRVRDVTLAGMATPSLNNRGDLAFNAPTTRRTVGISFPESSGRPTA
jgi:hypothetical protein